MPSLRGGKMATIEKALQIAAKAHDVIEDTPVSDAPVERWAVSPGELERAVAAAETELEDFARRLEPVLDAMGVAEIRRTARSIAGVAG